jgi:hypothetical protein
MHIPGKPLWRPKPSRFQLSDAKRLAYAVELRTANASPLIQKLNDMHAAQIEASIGRTTTTSSSNQRKIRKARRQAWAAGDRLAFAA